ncbi:peptide-binding protein [Streptomyces werraensis]|nr:peptide-binding protein [Streptomyces werraensis]
MRGFWTARPRLTDNHRVTSSFEFSTYPARLSDAERDKALSVLRDGVAKGRLSHDTFIRRMELALVARRADELAALTADLPRESRLSRAVFGTVESVSGFTVRLRRAWRAEKLPKLLLPHPAHGHPLRIGRDPANGLRLTHETVSRVHAELTHQGGLWVLRDLGSTNGTTVNGRRVVGAAVVRDGDQVGFGRITYRLAAN